MNDAIARIESLCVSDVMNREVVEILASHSMDAAAAIFSDGGVSAAPVVDDQGHCVGILSATDFLKCHHGGMSAVGRGSDPSEPSERVRSHMTTAVQTVAKDAPLLTAAKIMNAEHIHRLVVLDENEKPAGVVSTMDVVAALLNAIDEVEIRSALER